LQQAGGAGGGGGGGDGGGDGDGSSFTQTNRGAKSHALLLSRMMPKLCPPVMKRLSSAQSSTNTFLGAFAVTRIPPFWQQMNTPVSGATMISSLWPYTTSPSF